MENYIYEQQVKDDKKLEASFRKKINEWAASIPHHNLKNLGDQIEISDIWYKPAYPIRLRSQYEERGKHEGFEPYTNQKIPPRTIYKLSDFKAWDIELNDIDDFADSSTNYYVNGSQHVADCGRCDAKGWITCVQCGGRTTVTCPECSGAGKKKCGSCGGGGYHRCSSCSGRGTITRQVSGTRQVWVPPTSDSSLYGKGHSGYHRSEPTTTTQTQTCSACGGKGRNTCSSCGGSGKVTCSRCRGRGIVTCPRCSGSGRNTCPDCQGHKKLMHHFYVQRDLNFTNQATCIIHGEVFEKFPEYLVEYTNYESYNLLNQREENLEKGQLPPGNHLNPFIDEYIAAAHKETTKVHTLAFQQLDVECIDTWELKYRFQSKDYVMLFHGSTHEIVPGLSPIYEIAFLYWKKGTRAGRSYSYYSAKRLLKKAARIGTFEIREKVNEALEKVKEKMKSPFYFGTTLAAIFMVFFGGFVAYTYFKDVNYVFDYAAFINRPGNFLYKYHAWTQTLAFLALCLWAVKIVKKTFHNPVIMLPGVLTRFLLGFTLTAVLSAIFLVSLGLLNATGITILLTLMMWAVLWTIRIIIVVIYFALTIIWWLLKAAWGILKWIWGLFF
jgi:hypothetical protein